ncbi:MAG: DUF5606 domain-containing protein [Salinivirgaceae bacterium]|jgi:hypothetical protein|nr:DUF5606 domain-containing protein [Salinivirgaceae bacterium]
MLKDILSISQEPGLYKLVSKNAKGVIVENLETQRRMPFYATARISALEDIAIFTEEDDMPLKDVFKAMHDKENGGEAISHKASKNELSAYFEEVVPTYDKERVYASDIKKAIQWYNILCKNNLLDFSEDAESTEEKTEEKKEN